MKPLNVKSKLTPHMTKSEKLIDEIFTRFSEEKIAPITGEGIALAVLVASVRKRENLNRIQAYMFIAEHLQIISYETISAAVAEKIAKWHKYKRDIKPSKKGRK